MGTKNNPGDYDCYANADPDEPMFILLGRDRYAPLLVSMWAAMRHAEGEDRSKVDDAFACSAAMRDWLRHLGKTPIEVGGLATMRASALNERDEAREARDAALARAEAAERGALAAGNARLLRFVAAYDEWAYSSELCGGPLFDAMLEARDKVGSEEVAGPTGDPAGAVAVDSATAHELVDDAGRDSMPEQPGPGVSRGPRRV